ncbi:hypothetical protein QL285_051581 [Trifolium repens]|nr:hypothetical protein QL285_051581 [Trifolium repens]
MMLVKKEDLKRAEHPLKKIWEEYFWCDDFLTISEHDNEEVIKNFLEMVRQETGAKVDRSMVVSVPDWDIFKGPKEITRSKRKPVIFEQAMIEEGSEGQNEESEYDSIDELVDTAAEETIEVSKTQKVRAAEIAQEANTKKDRRSKKRNERPPASEDDKPVKSAKRSKSLAKKPSKKAASKDVDAKIRELEYNFSQSLRLLGGYVKSKIQSRGMTAVTQIMNAVERSHAPRLTFFNHEEECQRLELQAAVNESIRTSLEAAKRLTAEEITYVSRVFDAEQARIAAEVETKRLAEQEALRMLVERATRIAEVETQKLREAQEMGPQQGEDTIMLDQMLDEHGQVSDRGKHLVIDTTPPTSPVRFTRDSGSSSIPPAVHTALDEMKEEMKNEIDELRADMRSDMNASTEATNKKLDEMMDFLKNLASQMQKP